MLKFRTITGFRKDYERIKRRSYQLSLLRDALEKLCAQETLEIKYGDHTLAGSYRGFREYHIAPDWLLIHAVDKGGLILVASRADTHVDLFGK